MKKIITVLLASLIINQTALADSRMVIDTGSNKATIWSNEKFARSKITANTSEEDNDIPPGDIFVTFSTGKTYMIIDKKKSLFDMSSPAMNFGGIVPEKKPLKKLNINYKNKGRGETIAGLETTKYEISLEGKKCFDMLLTRNKAYSSVMKKFNSIPENYDSNESLCGQVESQISAEKEAKYGYIVKSTTADGKLDMLLLEFESGIKAPKKYLSFPAGYKIKSMAEMMQEMRAKQPSK